MIKKYLSGLLIIGVMLALVPLSQAQDEPVCDMDLARSLYNEALAFQESGDADKAQELLTQSQAIMAACQSGAPNADELPELPFELPEGIFDPANQVFTNGAWRPPVIYQINNVDMVLVPAGCVNLGSDTAADYEIENNSQPVHRVCFDEPFWIDRFEVTNSQVAQFTDQTFTRAELTLPYSNISWFDALAYCEARGARLPTEAEWEYAARGPDGVAYPWGNTLDGNLMNSCDSNCTEDNANNDYNDGYATVAPVGEFPDARSWVGAEDMSGNLWEWTSTIYEDYPYDATDGREDLSNTTAPRVIRGGGWAQDVRYGRAAVRAYPPPETTFEFYGVRCATDYVAPALAEPEPTAVPTEIPTELPTDVPPTEVIATESAPVELTPTDVPAAVVTEEAEG